MEAPALSVIIGSTREGRFGEIPARYVCDALMARTDARATLVDLRDWPLPFFDQPVTPSAKKEPYPHEVVERWSALVGESDGFILVTPEYNHGYPAALKNAIDWVFKEWNKKPVGFVSYGSAMGARAVEQLRQVAVEVALVPIRPSIHIPWDAVMKAKEDPAAGLAAVGERLPTFFDELIALATALKPLRG